MYIREKTPGKDDRSARLKSDVEESKGIDLLQLIVHSVDISNKNKSSTVSIFSSALSVGTGLHPVNRLTKI